MNTIGHAFLLILGFVTIALIGQYAVNKMVKQEVLELHHSAGEAMMGVVGTLFSVLLGFMVASAMDKYHDAQMRGEQEASNVASLFRTARGFSDIDRPRIRQLCREYVDDVIQNEWPQMEKHVKINHGWVSYQKLWEATVSDSARKRQTEQPAARCYCVNTKSWRKPSRSHFARLHIYARCSVVGSRVWRHYHDGIELYFCITISPGARLYDYTSGHRSGAQYLAFVCIQRSLLRRAKNQANHV
jgi:hypothetical protein